MELSWIFLIFLATTNAFPTEYSIHQESTAQGVAPFTLRATSPHPFQEQIGRPSAEVDRHVTPPSTVPLRAHRY